MANIGVNALLIPTYKIDKAILLFNLIGWKIVERKEGVALFEMHDGIIAQIMQIPETIPFFPIGVSLCSGNVEAVLKVLIGLLVEWKISPLNCQKISNDTWKIIILEIFPIPIKLTNKKISRLCAGHCKS